MAEPRRVFITGALGFIGQRLAHHYRERGAEMRGMDVRADPAQDVVAGDVSQPGDWQAHAEGCDLVIHTAAVLTLSGDPDAVWRVNVLGTRNALDAAVAGGAKRFVQLSSVLAFSWDFPDGVDERHPVRANGTPYVDTKVASEQVVLQAHAAGEIACTVIRPGDVWGSRSRREATPARARSSSSPTAAGSRTRSSSAATSRCSARRARERSRVPRSPRLRTASTRRRGYAVGRTR